MAKNSTLIAPVYRAAWADMMANDKELTPIAVRVGIIIGGHFNNKTAETYVGQDTLAKRMDVSARTIWGALDLLVKRKHLTCRQGGRATNYYGMPVGNVATYCEIYFEKSRKILRDLPFEISQNPVLNLATGCEQTLSSNSIDREAGANVEQFEPHARLWRSVVEAMKDRIGPDKVVAWIGKLSIIGITAGECRLAAPSKFIASWCENNFLGALQEAFRECQPAITSILIDVGKVNVRNEQRRALRSGGAA